MTSSPNWIAKLGALVFHEMFHYVAARALGLPATLQWNYVEVKYSRPDWRNHIVTLAPAAATIFLNSWAASRFIAHGLWFVLPIIAINTICWLLMCWQDFYDVIYMLRYHKLCDELVRPIPYFHQRWWNERKPREVKHSGT